MVEGGKRLFSNGNENIMLCERGIRTFENAYRNTLDFNAVAIMKEKSHLPVIVDSSHGIGIRRFVEPMSLAGIMAGVFYNLLLYWSRSIYVCIIAHSVTNLLLGIYVIRTGSWQFW